ncbi:hypothetical protein [Pontibacter ummariensis]|uniref:hypothetical protein n=1 Tax=Pontibacter ummariensis TaxID=1610492 RepID=UPI0015C68E0E|nr:hypothetical protein [Pontibacter ummariensis]
MELRSEALSHTWRTSAACAFAAPVPVFPCWRIALAAQLYVQEAVPLLIADCKLRQHG